MRTFKYSLLGLSIAMILVACGDDVTKTTYVTNEISGLEIVSSADSLGKCTEENSGEMKFVSKENAVYVCADSIWKNISAAGKDGSDGKDGANGANGEDGKDGSSCTALLLPDSSGYKVVCDGDSVGVLFNGRDGAGCSLTDNGDGSVTQICGKDSVTLYKAICGKKIYDPDSNFCYKDSVVEYCGGEDYDLSESFCFENSVYDFCDNKSYDPASQLCDTRDGFIYRFTVIGDQTWMAENLNYAYLQKTSLEDSSSFCYDNQPENCEKFGRLYTWSAAMKACPEGWRLPTTVDWSILLNFVADQIGTWDSVGSVLKSTSGWAGKNGSDIFAFSALPAGYYSNSNGYLRIYERGQFWEDGDTGNEAGICIFVADETYSISTKLDKNYASSVRCIKKLY